MGGFARVLHNPFTDFAPPRHGIRWPLWSHIVMAIPESSPTQPESDPQSPSETGRASGSLPDSAVRLGRWPVFQSAVLGILLPLAAICGKQLCAEALFDPAPTNFHIALLLLVPLHHLLHVLIHPRNHRKYKLDLLGAVTIGVSVVYSVLFAPILPMAVLAIVVGIGLLPLAPLGALVATLTAQRRIYLNAPARSGLRWYSRPWPRSLLGAALGISLLVGAELPSLLNERGLLMASSADPVEAAKGVRLLRHWGDREALLEATDDWGRRRTRLLPEALLPSIASPTDAKLAYYRVTGENAEAADTRSEHARQRTAGWDPYRGSSQIGPVNDTLELVASRLDGSVDAQAALGYAEWTMVFRNHAVSGESEARARVALPDGAVVSRVTLFIDGEPREAAFGGKTQTREAYQNVVRVRRDPLLVTMVGPNLAQVQCYPILPSAEMKILIGVTFPLQLERLDTGLLIVPYLNAHNFAISGGLEHRVWFESKQPLLVSGRQVGTNAAGAYVLDVPMERALRGEVPPAIVARRLPTRYAWTAAPAVEPPPESIATHAIIEQTLKDATPAVLSRLAIVMDTSSSMGSALKDVAEALPLLAKTPELRLLLATDEGYAEPGKGRERELGVLQAALRDAQPLGGIDNRAALIEATTWARAANSGVVLWVHGPQPVALGSLDPLAQSFERSNVRLVSAQVSKGEHVGLAELGVPKGLEALPRQGLLKDDLRRQFSQWSGAASYLVAMRSQRTVVELPPSPQTSDHLGRLWARSEVERARVEKPDAAKELAVAYRLVTPVSGAVVLENAAQYEAAKLDPARGVTGSPSVPEPETWAMLALAVGFILWQLRQRRVGWQIA